MGGGEGGRKTQTEKMEDGGEEKGAQRDRERVWWERDRDRVLGLFTLSLQRANRGRRVVKFSLSPRGRCQHGPMDLGIRPWLSVTIHARHPTWPAGLSAVRRFAPPAGSFRGFGRSGFCFGSCNKPKNLVLTCKIQTCDL